MKRIKTTLSNLKKLWPYARGNKKAVIIDIICMFFLTIISFITPYLSAQLIIHITNNNFDKLTQMAVIIFAIEILRNTLNMMCRKYFPIFYHNSCTNLRMDIMDKALALETFELDKNSSGVFIDRINKDAGKIPDVLDQMERLVFDFIMNIGILVTIFIINKILFIYILIAVTLIFLIEKVAINKRYIIDKKRREINEKITALIGESIRGIRDVKVLNADAQLIKRSKEDLYNSMNKTLDMNRINYKYKWFSGSTKDLYQLFLIVVGVYLINHNLINRLYKVDDNKLFLDKHDINTLNKNSIRNNIALITQNPYLFNFSISENLRFVKENATFEEIKSVCKQACIDDFIESLPNKYDTIIGEGGVVLSGGQKQRLAIARALLKKSEIILFDEATSALDNETQKDIKQAINNIKGEKTILMIAHRLSTISDADKIIVIDDGKKVGEGTHEELLANNLIYKHLYQTFEI